jgi:tRNA(fMet)-specific endonuclease VapC
MELEVGARRSTGSGYSRQIDAFLRTLDVLPLADSARSAYGEVRYNLERRGSVIGPLDMLIAAHALSLDATLVTNNEREFRRVAGLKLENWAA